MTQAEIEKAAEEYANKIYGFDAVPISWRQEDGFQLLAKARKQIADAFLAGAEHAGAKWISVKERLPIEGERILMHVPQLTESGEDIICGYADREIADGVEAGPFLFFLDGHNSFFTIGQVTHWMPLPAAPEAESK